MKHSPIGARAARRPYDPQYDPLTSDHPGRNRDYAPTYWIDTAGPAPADDGPVTADMDVDVAIVGSGYTGLSCAIHLAREHGIGAAVLEANAAAWGCSTRNGGQAQISAGRLKRSDWIRRWGVDVARAMHAEIAEAFDLFHALLRELPYDCAPQDGGHLYIAHRAKVVPALETESRLLNDVFGYGTRVIGRDELHRDFVRDAEAAGAVLEPDGMGVHAARLAFGYLSLARALGARVHPASPVIACHREADRYHLTTPGGVVRARAVCFATGGYTSPALHPLIGRRIMPVLSNSLVTRPLNEDELAACGFRTGMPMTDTRTLRHYYRFLPDRRVQIGSRSAITGADAPRQTHLDRLVNGLYRKFPALEGVEVDYSWWGWVDVSHDMMPRIFRPDPDQRVYYAMGYGGNGVMYSAQAGRRLAQMVAGKGPVPDLPIFASPLPSHGLLTPFRRIGQRFLYGWYYLRDEIA